MARLEELTRGTHVRGILADTTVTVVDTEWHGDAALTLTYRDAAGRLGSQLVFRDNEPTLAVEVAGRLWSFNADGGLLRLASEAKRIRLAYLFDPLLAVHTSLVDPLPHQITAVYEEMLSRQPLRFLLADDPGSGKTIMAGLLIKELLVRGDLQRCLIVCPGALVEQWQDELYRRFQLPFEILTNDKLEAARTGNWFNENPLSVARLDKLSRDEDVQAKLAMTDWDLIVCDEAHKLSATYFAGEAKYTKRFHLGRLLSGLTRHFLLMTATPHNGKEADFQLFLSLLDGDRFEGKYRDGIHVTDASDMMRRLVKEQMVRFDGRRLFPERRANTVKYALSDLEARLYRAVTEYVREEFNRAERLEEGRKGTVGFALTSLQRRLASSPEAIYQSIRRRREKLQHRLREEQLMKRGGATAELDALRDLPRLLAEDLDDFEEDIPGGEREAASEQITDQATAARTIAELEAEIAILTQLEALALKVRQGGTDRKWDEVSKLLQDDAEMFDVHGHRRKLLIFTEHRDTLNYLEERIRTLIGRDEAVVTIHGGMGREDRRKAQEAFTQDKDVLILIATDAAGEGINLQRAHLMVNYDLPWNPNRLEQRFGRIHRIGQTEVCHCWNMVAHETREGEVYDLLLHKLNEEKKALGDQVFDVLGAMTFENRSLRELLIEAVRYGDQKDVRARLTEVVDAALDRAHLEALLKERAISNETFSATRVETIREEMERAEARRLQPHYIASFFLEAFRHLGGTIHEREPGRYEITRVPSAVRARDRQVGIGEPVLAKYERIAFQKDKVSVPGKPLAAFVCPGHPLLDATIDLVMERHRDLLKQGAVLVDEADGGTEPRMLVYLEHAIHDGRTDKGGERRAISRRLQFVEMSKVGGARQAGYAPYLDYRPLTDTEAMALSSRLTDLWETDGLERSALAYAVQHLVPPHLAEVKERREAFIVKTMAAVKERLTKEINHWDNRAERLKEDEAAGKTPRMNSINARQRADELAHRLQKRMAELEQERHIAPLPPVVVGGTLVVPAGLLAQMVPSARAAAPVQFSHDAEARARVEKAAMDAVMARERELGFEPQDVSAEKRGYDIESKVPATGEEPSRLRFIEVKGRSVGAITVTVTKNEIVTALHVPEQFILALVEVDGNAARSVRYLKRPFSREPDFGATSVNYEIAELLRSEGQ
jgi:superfamily II DNA or RNA helicase